MCCGKSPWSRKNYKQSMVGVKKLKYKYNPTTKILCAVIAVVLLIFMMISVNYKSKNEEDIRKGQKEEAIKIEENLIESGEVFTKGSYIIFEDVKILYDGELFVVTNNRESDVIIVPYVVGTQKDGTLEMLGCPGFSGIDQKRYDEDFKANGWAVEHTTNRVRSGEVLYAKMQLWLFNKDCDVDNDGYLEIQFCIMPQDTKDEDKITISTENMLETEVYKISVDD